MENTNVNVNDTQLNNDVEATQTESTKKTFTEEQVNEMITKRIAREKKKTEAETEARLKAEFEADKKESERLAQMNEADRQAEKARIAEERLAERERLVKEKESQLEKEQIRRKTMEMLGERNIPVELAQFITSNNADEIMDNVNTFQKCFNESVEKIVANRMRGKTPYSISNDSKEVDSFLEGFRQY